MAIPTITVTPNPASTGVPAEAEVTFTPPPGSDVTIIVWDDTVTPPVKIKERTFSSDPYKVTFTPTNAGDHSVEVTWRDGQDTESEPFTVS